MSYRIILGGPCNSGKSTLVLSLVEALRLGGMSADAFELDVWSNSYCAFRGEIAFKDRPKRKGLDWDWKTPLEERVRQLRACPSAVAFGDLAGILDEAVDYACGLVEPHGAYVVSRTLEGIAQWSERFTTLGVPVIGTCLTFPASGAPLVIHGLDRVVDASHAGVDAVAKVIRGKIA